MAPAASDTLLLYFEIEQRNCLRSDKYPFQPPPPPPLKEKNLTNVSLTICLQTKTESCNHNQRRPELPYNAFVRNI